MIRNTDSSTHGKPASSWSAPHQAPPKLCILSAYLKWKNISKRMSHEQSIRPNRVEARPNYGELNGRDKPTQDRRRRTYKFVEQGRSPPTKRRGWRDVTPVHNQTTGGTANAVAWG